MKGLNNAADLFDPLLVMESDTLSSPSSHDANDFAFAFNDSNFSDRILQIEVINDPIQPSSNADGCSTVADWANDRKRRREDIKNENDAELSTMDSQWFRPLSEPFIGGNLLPDQPDLIDFAPREPQDEEADAMLEESPSGDEASTVDDANLQMDCSTVVKVKTLHISSPILAAKSPFFYKLFSNGMRESEQRHVTLRIAASEEAPLMELLNFMYSNSLSVSSPPALLDVLMAADKFEVASCMRYCSRVLRNIPMTPESALLYLDLPSSVLMADAVQPLTDAAKQYLASRYKDVTKHQEELMGLPLAGVEAILSSDELQVASEDAVYDFVLRWARTQYPKLEERREVLGLKLARFIRFPYMTCRKLKKVLTCNDFDHEIASKLVTEALFFKAEAPHRQRILAAESASSSRLFVERSYKYRPVKVVEFELPRQQCVVYLDLKREECANLFPSGRAFHLGGQGFFLSAHCNMDQQSSFHCFGLFLGMQEKGSVSFAVDYEFAARSRPTEEYVSKYKGNYTFTGGKAVGYRNLFATPWTSFMAEDSLYFINGVLHLRAELTIRNRLDVQV
ncbi:BTB/POZ domain-containing protein pob1-like [Trifolium pratense]|uniref:BTB/POZ domain-containing protein pob1-like n=2 Tax=Trifolium TaxID=3898 RepID=A0A2K3PCB8_TRIPR|nr:BTB/POZ domain-containing protein pob1-like [Trifolium pratense]